MTEGQRAEEAFRAWLKIMVNTDQYDWVSTAPEDLMHAAFLAGVEHQKEESGE